MWTAALGNGKEHWTWGIATLGMCSKAAMGWNNYELGAEVLRGRYISTMRRAATLVWDNRIEGISSAS